MTRQTQTLSKGAASTSGERQNGTDGLIAFEPAFTHEQIMDAEQRYDETWGIPRRIMLSVLTNSGHQLAEGMRSNGAEDTIVKAVEQIQEYQYHLKHSLKLATSAVARLQLVAHCLAKPSSARKARK